MLSSAAMPKLRLLLACAFVVAGCNTTPATDIDAGGEPDAGMAIDAPVLPDAPEPAEIVEVEFTTSVGTFVLELHRSWSPIGVQHFLDLVELEYYDDTRFFRVLVNYIAQFGMNGVPSVNAMWDSTNITDDPRIETNALGTVSFASLGTPNTRAAQLFVNLRNNPTLDGYDFVPIGRITTGLDILGDIYSGYGETPDQYEIRDHGNEYLDTNFPMLTHLITVRVR